MNFNTILLRLGIDPSSFINEEREPIKTDDGYIYEVRQRTDIRLCPYCGSVNAYINDHDVVEINCSETDQIKDTLRIYKVRFKCKDCNKTYTPEINGIEAYKKISRQTEALIVGDFTKMMTFKAIGTRYGISTARIMQIFDDKVPFIPRGKLPKVLCIDEISFDGDINQKYCCVLYDHQRRELLDLISNRQLPYLNEYFSAIPEKERNSVRYFVSDMYDGYRRIYKTYFGYAIHIIDLFHVIKLLTAAINSLRYNYVKRHSGDSGFIITFMKIHWKLFICRRENIPDKWYEPKGLGKAFHYSDLVFESVKKDSVLLEGYNILQDLYHYSYNDTFMESLKFIDYISERLKLTGNELLSTVGYSYEKWRIEIANGIAKNQNNEHYSNGIAESVNNHLKTIIKNAYGYHNFERFRKRAMLICRYKKI